MSQELHCPLCDEAVSARAIVCPHCGAEKVRGLLLSEHRTLASGIFAAGLGGAFVAFKTYPNDNGAALIYFGLFAAGWFGIWMLIATIASFRTRWVRPSIR